MRIYPFLLDSRPAYLQSGGEGVSLLLAPLCNGTVLDFLAEQVAACVPGRLTVLTDFTPTVSYVAAVQRAKPDVEGVLPVEGFLGRLISYPPTDGLLFIDPRCLPPTALDLRALLDFDDSERRWVCHLVALENTPAGTKESVQLDVDGRVQRIQRYYEQVNWPLAAGVVASLLPIASALVPQPMGFGSLWELRGALSALGVPSRDISLSDPTFYLGTEQGLLGLNERLILEGRCRSYSRNGASDRRPGPEVHPGARLLGPVVVQQGAIVEEGAIVVGPSVLGAGCRVGRDAIVAQSVIGAGVDLLPETIVRHRVVSPLSHETAQPMVLEPPSARHFSGTPAVPNFSPVSITDEANPHRTAILTKCIVEAIVSFLALLVQAPLLLLIAIAVKLDSRGPIFYGDVREGRDGRRFRCWKFRTMVPDADARQRELAAVNKLDGPQFKLERDPRVTRVGAWLRLTNVDEIPQLWNVAVGEMSLVGPRPSPFRENQTCVPWREGRLSVRPGITGLWQVCRHDRSTGDFHQWIYYDLLYVRHMSPWLDLKILAFTFVTLGGKRPVPLTWLIPARRLYGRDQPGRTQAA
jgi:lipopolysaccharide/colanic/teichoic acid biosynthesis glycosyltransferase